MILLLRNQSLFVKMMMQACRVYGEKATPVKTLLRITVKRNKLLIRWQHIVLFPVICASLMTQNPRSLKNQSPNHLENLRNQRSCQWTALIMITACKHNGVLSTPVQTLLKITAKVIRLLL